jgi:hypothetical protein
MYENATQIDPVGCGCTECIVGEYVPLDRATGDQVFKLIKGKLLNATGERFIVDVDYLNVRDRTVTITIESEYSGRTWTVVRNRS